MLLLAAAALQIGARLVLRTLGLPRAVRVAQWLRGPAKAGHYRRAEAAHDLRALRWALAASASRVGGTCLTQAVAALALSAPASGAARLVVGVRPGEGAPEFHAWTEISGVSLPATPGRTSFAQMIVWS